MRTILVPTDFSYTADKALNYACEINKKLNAEIMLFHSYHVPAIINDAQSVAISDEEQNKGSEDALKVLKERFEKQFPGMNFNMKAVQGLATEGIVEEEKNTKIDLLVMGTQGASGLREILLGSNTAIVIENSICPVLAVPENSVHKTISNILFATDFNESDFLTLTVLAKIAEKFNATISIVHVSETAKESEFESNTQQWIEEELESKYQARYNKLKFHCLVGGDVEEELNYFIGKNDIDLISLTMRKRGALSKLFDRSLTKKLVNHTHIPLIAFRTK